MDNLQQHNNELLGKGFTVIPDVFTYNEVDVIANAIEKANSTNDTFRKSADLFAIRQFLKELPQLEPVIFNKNLLSIIHHIGGKDFFVVKSIYFDKPPASNWYVAYHQDLTISVKEKTDMPGFGPWTVKQNQFAVQPPVGILENNFTIRIHLDETNEENGALKVIPGSHNMGIQRPEKIDWNKETQESCCVTKGGIMIMKPLLLHSSGRTANDKRRRVVHIEFSNALLPGQLQWAEKAN